MKYFYIIISILAFLMASFLLYKEYFKDDEEETNE